MTINRQQLSINKVVDDPIQVRGLVKQFGRHRALDGLDLSVTNGEVHGFLGPNGAGKSTTMRVLLGLLRRDAGQVRLLGGDPHRDAVALHRQLAYVPGDVSVWKNLTGGEAIDLLSRLRGISRPSRRDEFIERFALDPTKRCGTYSKGNRQKVALIAAFASDVPLYLFDEPTSGLDPLMIHTFQEAVQELRSSGRTVLLSSHVMSEVEALSDRVSIIRNGRNIETGTLGELRLTARTSVVAETVDPPQGLAGLGGIHGTKVSEDGRHIQCDVDADHLDDLLGLLRSAGLRSLSCAPPSLEELFLRHYDNTESAEPCTAGAAR